MLQQTINMFNQVNIDCAQSNETIVPFSSNQSVVEFYVEQMENLDFSDSEIDEFRNYLESMPT